MSRTTEFDKEEIIAKAMQLFWEKGYEGTSLKDLTEATGLLKGSIYNSFHSKEKLFLLCLEKYEQNSRNFFYQSGDPLHYLKTFFKRLVSEGADKNNTKGCLIMNSCLEFSGAENKLANKSQLLFKAIELNFENVVRQLNDNSSADIDRKKTALVTAAFSIREISKFHKDKQFLVQIANNGLKDFGLTI